MVCILVYGFPLSSQPKYIKSLDIDQKNLLYFSNYVWIILPRTKRYKNFILDENNKSVKLSKIMSYTQLTKEDLIPTNEEIETLTLFAQSIKRDAKPKFNFYAIDILLPFPEGDDYFMNKYFRINMDK